ncbi:conserved phage C-terminal domain-containing protein [Paenibacillus larvae]|uniref:conserved phage C-terminal domain-containing protein n=1 Tax=Paenibacillus larvae TaxID=1464 RepID=UPI00227E008B|nr:conserved phage C-terminal domain-containing protein [Paenibacillus larvae]MCY9512378.1 conserved phage C-terminal domain-containing protein [Paenibacillus larvae]MCY9527494.1 conserved phage C-terminal domain-containing protein [Paenibacillus larvae]
MDGWIKLHRKILDNPIVCKDSDYAAVWMYLLLNATHKEHPVLFAGKRITLHPGQLITGRKAISEKFKISESKVQRILKSFENEQQIEQQNSNKNRLITILSWSDYQSDEQQTEQQVNNKRTTTEQQVNTNKNVKNDKNVEEQKNNNIPFSEIIDYLNSKAGTKYRVNTKATQRHISARWKEGYKLDDFKTVIDKKVQEWKGTQMEQYLRPETLFGTKFESYLNQKGVTRNAQQQRPTPFKPDNANHTPGKTEASVQSTANSGYAAGDTEPDWSIFVRG